MRPRPRGSAGRALVRLAEGGATVGTPPLAQREAEEEAQGEEEDGTQDSQAGEVVLQDADSAGGTASSWLPCDQTMTSHPFTSRGKEPHPDITARDARSFSQTSFVSNLTHRWLAPPDTA